MDEEEKRVFREKEKVQSMSSNKPAKVNPALFKSLASRVYVWAFVLFAFFDVFQLFTILVSEDFT